jgi:DNA invertase Pin-like site-specific DNA recombinase
MTEQIDTSSPMGKAMVTVISALAEFERSLISERVRSGIAKARAMGKQYGRPQTSADTIKAIQCLPRQGKSLNNRAKQLGVSHQTVANYSS